MSDSQAPGTKPPSAKEIAALRHLDPLMDAPALSIGRAIFEAVPGSGSNLIALGASVCSRLQKRRLVVRFKAIGAWRITAEGRQALRVSESQNA